MSGIDRLRGIGHGWGVSDETQAKPDYGPAIAHVAPFIAWLFFMQMLGDPAGWKYAVRSVACLGLFLWLRPWQWYPRLSPKNVPLAIAVGLGVFVLWVIGESTLVPAGFRELYVRWAVMPFGEMREPMETLPYAPETCGWFLTGMRVFGSAFVIAPIEEYFWRGFLYRWSMGGDFLQRDVGSFHAVPFLIVALSFGFIHAEWFAGILTGLIYGWFVIRTRDLWAASIAHMITNLVLGLYVVATGSYQFW